MGLCERYMNVLILLYHHKGQARFLRPWLCFGRCMEIETGILECLLYPCQIALMTFHVFSFRASRAVRKSGLNMVVAAEKPLASDPLLKSAPCKCNEQSLPLGPYALIKTGRGKERFKTIGPAVLLIRTISVNTPELTLPAFSVMSQSDY